MYDNRVQISKLAELVENSIVAFNEPQYTKPSDITTREVNQFTYETDDMNKLKRDIRQLHSDLFRTRRGANQEKRHARQVFVYLKTAMVNLFRVQTNVKLD